MNPISAFPTLLAIFTGAGLGGLARYVIGTFVTRHLGTAFPYGTLGVNLLGGLILGLLVGYLTVGQGAATPLLRLFLVTGVLGGFTTFSAFTLESLLLLERNQLALALAYILASVCGAILALAAGMWLARHLAS